MERIERSYWRDQVILIFATSVVFFMKASLSMFLTKNVTDKETKLKELPSLEFPEGRRSVIARSSGSRIIILLQTVARKDRSHPQKV